MSASNSDHPPVFRGNLPNSPALSDARPTIAQTLSAEPDNYAQSEEALIKRAWDECNLLSLGQLNTLLFVLTIPLTCLRWRWHQGLLVLIGFEQAYGLH